MRKHDKRVTRLDERIQAMRPGPTTAADALAHFRETGELPGHDWLAADVVKRTLRLPHPVSLREQLLREAVSDFEPVRDAARFVLQALIRSGLDVGSRNFLDEDMDPHELGSLGLHLLGWPEILVRPPYEAQAMRVIRDQLRLKEHLAGDQMRIRKLTEGGCDFFRSGALPKEGWLRDAVIAYAEFVSLHDILGGEQDDAVLAAFDAVGTSEGEARGRAIEQLQALAREGRIS